MPQINLLPWRQELRKARQKQFIQISLLVVLLTALLMAAFGAFLDYRTDLQLSRNQIIEHGIRDLNREISEVRALRKKRDQLLEWVSIVQRLQTNRSDPIRIFNDLAHATGESLYLTRLEKKDNQLLLEGEAADNRAISGLMRNLARSDYLLNPVLTDVSASTANPGFNRFKLTLQQKSSASQPEEEATP